MKIIQINQRFVQYVPENDREKKILETFPGFTKIGFNFYSVAKPHVVANLAERLRVKKCIIRADDVCLHYLNDTFKLRQLPDSFTFFTSPLPHQTLALRFAYTLGSCGLLLEPGMGKTKIVLDLIALMSFKKSLIACPKALLFVWEDEQRIHRPDKSIYVIQSTDWEKEREAALAADIVVTNYNKVVMMKDALSSIKWDYINLDEFLIKDPKSKRTQAVLDLGKDVPYKTGTSGTLVNNSPMDVFAPVKFLEPTLVSNSYSKFSNEYEVKIKGKKADGSEVRFGVGFRRIPEIRDILASCSLIMTKEEWLKDLPEKVFKEIIVPMSDEQRLHFEELSSNYITKIGDTYVEVDNPLTVLCKLLQISNGFIYMNPDDPEEQAWIGSEQEKKPKGKKAKRVVHYFAEQPKVNRLIRLLKEELAGRRLIVWYNLSSERVLIEAALLKAGVTFTTIAGGEKHTGDKVRNFNRDQTQTVLLCQAKSVNYGITVLGITEEKLEAEGIEIIPDVDTGVYTHVFFSLSFSLETFLQQLDRSHRIGQTHTCEYYTLLSNSSIESEILSRLKGKMELRESILVDILNSSKSQLFTPFLV